MKAQKRVICVDLDGTLVKEETHILFMRWVWRARRRWFLSVMLKSILRGSQFWKKVFAQHYLDLQALDLTYNWQLIEKLRQEKIEGATLVLITGAPQCVAEAVARNVDLFNVIIGSTGRVNCVGRVKERLLTRRWGRKGYIYAGNSWRDIFPWRSASAAWVVGRSRWVNWLVRRYCTRIVWLTFPESNA